jgi:hypothetical protein
MTVVPARRLEQLEVKVPALFSKCKHFPGKRDLEFMKRANGAVMTRECVDHDGATSLWGVPQDELAVPNATRFMV